MKRMLFLALITIASISKAGTVMTLYNESYNEPTHDIAVKIFNLDGDECYENLNISKYRYRTQIEDTDLKCTNSSEFVLFADYAGATVYHYTHKLKKYGFCEIQHYKESGHWPTLNLICG